MRGRQKELLELLDRSGADLFTLLTRLTLREDIAEELMQELFIKLINCTGPGDVTKLDAYAHRAAINLAFDWRRGRKRASLRLERIEQPAANEESPLAKLISSERLQKALDAIEKLNKSSREIIIMRYIQQDSYDNIAEKLGKTPHQVRALCSRAVSRLRDILGADRHELYERKEENVKTE